MCMCRTGNQMATAGADKVVKLWDPTTGAHKASLRVSLPLFLPHSPLWSVVFFAARLYSLLLWYSGVPPQKSVVSWTAEEACHL